MRDRGWAYDEGMDDSKLVKFRDALAERVLVLRNRMFWSNNPEDKASLEAKADVLDEILDLLVEVSK